MVFVRKYAIEIGLAIVLVAALAFGWERNTMRDSSSVAPVAAPVSTPLQTRLATSPVAVKPSLALRKLLPGVMPASLDVIIAGSAVRCCTATTPTTIEVKRSDTVELRGWALDAQAGSPAAAVFGSVGATPPVAFAYGGNRADVASALHNPAYVHVAFDGTIPANALAPGLNAIVLDIVAGAGDGYYRTPTRFTLDVR